MKRIKIFFFSAGCWLLAYHCAQVVTPAGGPKDTSPPRVVKYIPDSAAVNVKVPVFSFVFDEYIQLKDLNTQLLISPPVEKMPEAKLKRKTLSLRFQDSLKKNTTYTLNFGNAIADITEGNTLENFQYVFSTGGFLDSLSLSGTVQNGFDLKTEAGILVLLYDNLKDSVPYKEMPVYFAKTQVNGSYQIRNIRPGTYRAFVLKDKNGNYLYDAPDETVAFCDTILRIHKNISLDFRMFKELPQKQELKKAYTEQYGKIVFVCALPLKKPEIKSVSELSIPVQLLELSDERDTLIFWYDGISSDSLKLTLLDEGKIIDTAAVRLITKEQMKKAMRGSRFEFKVNTNVHKNTPHDINDPIIISFNHPLEKGKTFWTDNKEIFLSEDSLRLKRYAYHSSLKQVRISNVIEKTIRYKDTTSGNISVTTTTDTINWKENTSYHLFIPPKTLTDIFGLTNDTIKIDFKTREEKYYGTLQVNLTMEKVKTKFIFQLLDEHEKVVREETKDYSGGKFDFLYLHPGKYKMKIILDKDGNGKWTTGNYLEKNQPEKVIYYPGTITIRSNWDMELDWKVE